MRALGSSPSFNTYNYKPRADIEKLRAGKREFLKEFSSKYGYNGKIDQIREEDYPQLKGEIYLDHTGATTFARTAVMNFHDDILTNLYGNPHSNSTSSQASSIRIDGVRKRILKYFNTNVNDYNVIFTQNATAAIKLVGEMFPWSENSTYKHLRESHNSINGLRRFLEQISPENIQGVTEDDVKEMIENAPRSDDNCRYDYKYHDEDDDITYNLFAYPAQCNFSGMRFPLSWVSKTKKSNTKRSRTLVLLDAAAFVPSAQLSLADKDASPDFVCLSFYKMFGYPTGLGALIVKTELNPILRKGYFGGGTINSVVYDRNWQEFSSDMPTRYEDGTVNYLNIIALDHAIDSFERMYGNIKNVSNHVTSLNTYLSRNMKSLRHWNGQNVITVNSDRDFSDSKKQGGIFSFNVKHSDGSTASYIELEKLASSYGIHIRSGGNCNPGSLSRWNDISADEVIENYGEGKYCSDGIDIYKGKLYGAARVSIGAMTTIEDILIWLDFFKRNYVEIMPGKTIHDFSSFKLTKSAKIFNHAKPSKAPEDVRPSKLFDHTRESDNKRHTRESDNKRHTRESDNKRSPKLFDHTRESDNKRSPKLFDHTRESDNKRSSKLFDHTGFSMSSEDTNSSKLSDDKRSPRLLEHRRFAKSSENLKASKHLKYVNTKDDLRSPKVYDYEHERERVHSTKSRENSKSSGSSHRKKYHTSSGAEDRRRSVRNAKSLFVVAH